MWSVASSIIETIFRKIHIVLPGLATGLKSRYGFISSNKRDPNALDEPSISLHRESLKYHLCKITEIFVHTVS